MAHITLADATDLAHWADRLDSQARMPRLMRLLIHATVVQPEKIGFPSDEGVQLGGWDGVVSVLSGNAWVPSGPSVWEIGTNKAVKGKADDDYEKRKIDTLGLTPSDTTFVFITPRRWGGKEKWLASRRAEGFFRDVRAYDADDLAACLEQAPAVHVWLTLQLGKRSEGMIDLSRFWSDWANVTRPPISPELMTIGREEVVTRIHAWLRGTPSALGVQADSREEALAFFIATLHALPLDERANFLSRSLVVTDIKDWQPVCGSANPLVLVPMFDQREGIAVAVEAGHYVLVAIGKDEWCPPGTVLLPPLRSQQALAALGRMGVAGVFRVSKGNSESESLIRRDAFCVFNDALCGPTDAFCPPGVALCVSGSSTEDAKCVSGDPPFSVRASLSSTYAATRVQSSGCTGSSMATKYPLISCQSLPVRGSRFLCSNFRTNKWSQGLWGRPVFLLVPISRVIVSSEQPTIADSSARSILISSRFSPVLRLL